MTHDEQRPEPARIPLSWIRAHLWSVIESYDTSEDAKDFADYARDVMLDLVKAIDEGKLPSDETVSLGRPAPCEHEWEPTWSWSFIGCTRRCTKCNQQMCDPNHCRQYEGRFPDTTTCGPRPSESDGPNVLIKQDK